MAQIRMNIALRRAPEFRGRSPEEIISQEVYFDSVGYTYRSLSWLDISKRERNVPALQYAAHDVRQAVEQLLFEEIIMSVGTELDRKEYEKCKGNSTKLYKVVRRLNPDYQKLVKFTQAIASADPQWPPIESWDHNKLMKHWGMVSNYLHWAGEPAETVESDNWLSEGISFVENAAEYIWHKMSTGYTGIMMSEDMQPEIRECWERFRVNEISFNAAKRIVHLAQPVLRQRLNRETQRN